MDIGADEEALLTKDEDKPVFVTNFPKAIKAFYMREDPGNPGTVLNAWRRPRHAADRAAETYRLIS